MKYMFLIFGLFLVGCASNTISFPEQKGTVCLDTQVKEQTYEKICYPARIYLDPTRFHKLNDYQKNHMPEMP